MLLHSALLLVAHIRPDRPRPADGSQDQFWLDKACINQQRISHGLRSLPVNVMACNLVLVMWGPATALHLGTTCGSQPVPCWSRFLSSFGTRRPEQRFRLMSVVCHQSGCQRVAAILFLYYLVASPICQLRLLFAACF